jgi:hypothetical protein
MPTVRHAKPRNRYAGISDYQLAYLLDRELPEPTADDEWWELTEADCDDPAASWHGRSAGMLWRAHEQAFLSMWVADYPGYRPRCWWRYSAPRQPIGRWSGCWWDGKLPEPRRRLGGTGTPAWEGLAYVPMYDRGIPAIWITARHYALQAELRTTGRQSGCIRDGGFMRQYEALHAAPFDPADPPIYESQAVYLERHGLFLAGERRLLRKSDWEPEAAQLEEEEEEV